MTLASYFSFFILVFIMVFSPGPMTLFLMANGMRMNAQKIWPILMGANNAYLLSILVFTLGLTQLLQRNIVILKALQILGILYLFYLAYKQWSKKYNLVVNLIDNSNKTSAIYFYIKGALIALSNPKTIVLFGFIFPQFIINKESELLQTSILGITFLLLQFSSGCTYAYLGKSINKYLEKPIYQNLTNKVSAVILLLVAIFLFLKM